MKKIIHGAEAVVLKGDCVVLGLQNKHRWDKKDGNVCIAIKTIGGEIEGEESPRECVVREFFEEIESPKGDISIENIVFQTPMVQYSENCGVRSETVLRDKDAFAQICIENKALLPYNGHADIQFNGTMYVLSIVDVKDVIPKDLPALCVIPVKDFLALDFTQPVAYEDFKKYIITDTETVFPQNTFFVFMLPEIVKDLV